MRWSPRATPALSWDLRLSAHRRESAGGGTFAAEIKAAGFDCPGGLSDPASTKIVVDRIRIVGGLLAALGAPFLVLADAQSEARDRIAGKVQGWQPGLET